MWTSETADSEARSCVQVSRREITRDKTATLSAYLAFPQHPLSHQPGQHTQHCSDLCSATTARSPYRTAPVTVTPPCRQPSSLCCHTAVQTALVTVLSHRRADSPRHCAVTALVTVLSHRRADSSRHHAVTPCRQPSSACCHTVQTALVSTLSHRADSPRQHAVIPCRQPSSVCCHTVQNCCH